MIFNSTHWEESWKAFEEGKCQGWIGAYPEEKDREAIKSQLYLYFEGLWERHFHERDFLLRYLLSMLVFLAMFFFLSYVVKDPIPLADEVFVSIASAVLFQIWWKRKRIKQERALSEKRLVRAKIDQIPFQESPFLATMEIYLNTVNSMSGRSKEELLRLTPPIPSTGDPFSKDELALALLSLWPRNKRKKERILISRSKKLEQKQLQDFGLSILMYHWEKD